MAAPEAANNATSQAGFIPLMALGIPASPTLAILMGGLMLYGLKPGPLLFKDHPDFVWTVIASMYIGNFILLVLNLPLVGLWAKMTTVPYGIMGPVILIISIVGAFSVNNSLFDIFTALVFGVLGYLMRKYQWPAVPLVLCFVLGPKLERSVIESLAISGGDVRIFFQSGISVGLLIAAAVMLFISLRLVRRTEHRVNELEGEIPLPERIFPARRPRGNKRVIKKGAKMKMKGRLIAVLVIVAGMAAVGHAQEYPTRNIEYIVPTLAGGGTDLSSRAIAEFASKRLGQAILPVNKPGGGTAVGLAYAMKQAKADGYTVFAETPTSSSMMVAGMVTPPVLLEDRTFAGRMIVDPMAYAVKVDAPWKTFKEFSAWAKANPDKLTWVSLGPARPFRIRDPGLAGRHRGRRIQDPDGAQCRRRGFHDQSGRRACCAGLPFRCGMSDPPSGR